MLTIPGYKLLEQVASGASGTVYRAEQSSLRRIVAVKLLNAGLFDAAETRARFLRETHIQASLSHPNLLPLYDAGFARDRPYLATEFVGGGTVRDLLAEHGSLSVLQAVRLARAIASGLDAAHTAGIAHRDLKPENVLLTDAGQPKVADFGLARAVSGGEKRLTASGVILGTPGYMDPNAVETGEGGAAADLYALGVMLYEMLAGRRPFAGDDVADLLSRQLRGEFSPLGQARSGLPPGLEELVHRCLARQPRDRPASAAEVVASLEAAEAAGAGAPVRAARTVAGQSRERRAASGDATVRHSRPAIPAGTTPAPPASVRGPAAALALAAMLAGLGVLAIGPGRAWLRAPGITDAPLATVPIVRPAAAPPALPAILRVTRGATAARLWLARPAPAGAVIRCRPEKASSQREEKAVAGSVEQFIGGLQPATRYEAALAAGSTSCPVRFETLAALVGTQGARISTGDCEQAVLRARGQHVAVAWIENWSRPTAAVLVRESSDGGQTWDEPQRLYEGETGGPTLAVTAIGTVVCWPAQPRPTFATRCRLGQSRSWTPAVERPGRGIHLSPGDRDTLDCLLQDGDADRWGYRQVRLEAGGLAGFDALPAWLPVEGDYVRLLARVGSRLLAFSTSTAHEPPLAATFSDTPASGPWTALKQVVPRSLEPSRSRMDAVASGDTVVLILDNQGRVLAQASHDRGKSFSEPRDVMGTYSRLNYQKMPAVVWAEGRFHAVFVHTAVGSNALVALAESADGERWTVTRRAPVPLFFSRGIGMCAAVAGSRLLAVVTGNSREGLSLYSFDLPRAEGAASLPAGE